MKEKNKFYLNTVKVLTIILLYYIVGKNSLFLYIMSLSLYQLFVSCFSHISLDSTNKKGISKIFKITLLIISITTIVFLLLGIFISDLMSVLLHLNNLTIIFIFMGLSIITEPLIKLLTDYYFVTTNHKFQKLKDLYYVLDNIILLIIALFTFRIFHVKNNIAIALLYLSKILSTIIVTTILYLINKKRRVPVYEENINYKKEIKKILTKDSYKSTINIVKNSYYYLSIIILYWTLSTRYKYALTDIENIITFIYLYSLTIINYLIYLAKKMNEELPKEMTATNRIYNNFKVLLTIAIVFGFISPLTCKVIFNSPANAIYLMMTNFMAIFILLYDITYENIKNRLLIYISLFLGLIVKIITIIPLINAFYRMGYNLVYGDIISTIIGMFISIIINYIYLKKIEKKASNYFEKILNILYENIILSIILVMLQFIIPMNTNSYFKSLGLIIIYIVISIAFIKIKNKKRG